MALSCSGIVKRFGDVVAVDGLDMVALRGECLGLLGPNGAGKTTTVEILEGLMMPDRGEVEILGMRWGQGRDQELRTRIGVALQETQLADKLTVREIVRMFSSFYPRGREVNEVIELLGLTQKAGAAVDRLSGGQRQRLALACALVGDPDLLFLDEPTTGLDPQARLRIWEVVERFREKGGTVVLTTHYMEEAARLCDRVAIIDLGRLVAEGSPHQLVDSLGAQQMVELRADPPLDDAALAVLPGVGRVSKSDDMYRLAISGIGEALPALIAELDRRGSRVVSLTTREPTMEDVFVHMTGKGLREG